MAVPVNFFQRENAAVFPGKPGFLAAGMGVAAMVVGGVATLGEINPPLEGTLCGETTPPVATTGVVMVVLVVVAK